jgi:hypothetical protein
MMRTQRVRRPIPELLQRLDQHVKLLREYAVRAFNEGDEAYLGEVAAKLRLLVYERGQNTPLLLALMDELKIEVPIVLDLPGPPRPPISLREYLEGTAFAIRVSSGEMVDRSNKEIIGIWAQQHGAAHEDWELSEEFVAARGCGVEIGGRSALAASLRVITNTVLYVATEFFRKVPSASQPNP